MKQIIEVNAVAPGGDVPDPPKKPPAGAKKKK